MNIMGLGFGAVGSSAVSVYYVASTPTTNVTLSATGCSVVTMDVAIRCSSAVGAGKGCVLDSTVPAFAPHLHAYSRAHTHTSIN